MSAAHPADQGRTPAPPAGPGSRPDPYAGLPDDYLLAPAPTVATTTGEVRLAEWLRHYAPREGLLMEVVEEMYRRAFAVPAVADYFPPPARETLPRKFHATLALVATRGLTVGMARRMAAVHVTVHNSKGEPITGEVFDAVVATVAGVLTDFGIPERTLQMVAAAVAPLRPLLAVDHPGPAEPAPAPA